MSLAQNSYYLGCFNDGGPSNSNKNGDKRGLPNYRGNVNSIQACQDLAKKNDDFLFGLQYGGQCFTGSDLAEAIQWGKATGKSCDPQFGGAWVNQIYVINDNRKNQISNLQQQLNNANTKLSMTDASCIAMNTTWQQNFNNLQNQYSNTLTQLSDLQIKNANASIDISSAETNLSNLLNLVSNQVNNISKNFINTKAAESFSPLSIMREGLSSKPSPYDTLTNYQNNIQSLNNIVQSEQQRLQQKQQSVDSAFYTQNRLIEFNESAKKRTQAFNYIIIVIVIAFIIIFVLLVIYRFLPFIPVPFFVVLILSVAIIIIIYKLVDIYSRWNMDYDIYSLQQPVLHSINYDLSNNPLINSRSNILNSLNINSCQDPNSCQGPNCCSTGTTWNAVQGKCFPMTTSPTTPSPMTPSPMTPSPMTPSPMTPSPMTPSPMTPSPTTTKQPFQNMEPSEYNSYSQYKM
jgi:hypothetical protein